MAKLLVPDHLNRNEKSVHEMDSPANTGKRLIEYMCGRIGVADLGRLDVLDLGCGVRFSEALINLDLPIGRYTGIDVAGNVVDFLKQNVRDDRFSYHLTNTANKLYNPRGETVDLDAPSPLGAARFDLACMFSVITHQDPQEAPLTFGFLRRHIRPTGHLFFSANVHHDDVDYKELTPERPGLRSSYALQYMTDMLMDAGWRIVTQEGPLPYDLPIMASFHCKPIGR